MTTDYLQMTGTAVQAYAGCLSAAAELSARALRSVAADAAELADGAAVALRAPAPQRGSAVEDVVTAAFDIHCNQLRALSGAGPYWTMAVLNRLAAAQAPRQD